MSRSKRQCLSGPERSGATFYHRLLAKDEALFSSPTLRDGRLAPALTAKWLGELEMGAGNDRPSIYVIKVDPLLLPVCLFRLPRSWGTQSGPIVTNRSWCDQNAFWPGLCKATHVSLSFSGRFLSRYAFGRRLAERLNKRYSEKLAQVRVLSSLHLQLKFGLHLRAFCHQAQSSTRCAAVK